MAGLSEPVVYNIDVPMSLKKKESAIIPIANLTVTGVKVLQYDPKASEVNAAKCIHIWNSTTSVFAPGTVCVLEEGRFLALSPFSPMLPNDDQLIPYGFDSSVSVFRTFPSEFQVNKTVGVQFNIQKQGTKDKPKELILTHHVVKATQYVVKNNSTLRNIDKFYIDHTADPSLGGFVIKTTENCIKSVTGWSRYQFSIPAQKEITFLVIEEATHSTSVLLSALTSLITFITRTAPTLLESKVLSQGVLDEVKNVVFQAELVSILRKIQQSDQITDRLVKSWKEGYLIGNEKKVLLPQKLLDVVSQIVELERKMSEASYKVNNHNEYIKKVFLNQDRLRENIKSMEKVHNSSLVDRYLKDLSVEEDSLIRTRAVIDQLEEEKLKLQEEVKNWKHLASLEAAALIASLDA
eukprot:TRINITY_DN668_c0_g1_i1.p1 TRINITY_DN668_c0_g1~~TRINITY_DN668_c0_g1_i1.p1  ORF type:complete len:408 (-),score=124.08 TRINITY_DN668_c0_g1_i1:119-1342(-)